MCPKNINLHMQNNRKSCFWLDNSCTMLVVHSGRQGRQADGSNASKHKELLVQFSQIHDNTSTSMCKGGVFVVDFIYVRHSLTLKLLCYKLMYKKK